MHRHALFAAAALLAAASPTMAQNFGALQPARISAEAARQVILAHKAQLFRDPASLRDASIGKPYACRFADGGDCVCLRLNGRNAYGGFTGLHTVSVQIKRGAAEVIGPMGDNLKDCGPMSAFPQLTAGSSRGAKAVGAPK